MNTVEKFKSFLTCLGLATASRDMLEKRDEWILSLSENEIIELLNWSENPNQDELLDSLSKPSRLSVLQEMIIISATAGKRLNSDKIREAFEVLYTNPHLKELVIEGIDIYGSTKSLPFLASIISSETNEETLIDVASALNSIGGEESLRLLFEIKNKAQFSKPFYQELLDEIIQEVKSQ